MMDSRYERYENHHDHEKYLLKPPLEALRTRLKVFGVDESELQPLPLICNLKIRQVVLTPRRKFDPTIGEIETYVRYLSPRSLGELKELVGVPNRVMKNNTSCAGRRDLCMHHLPGQKDFSFQTLDPEQRIAVRDAAHNLLYGYVDEDRASRGPLKAVSDYMLEVSQNLGVFVAQDLIVCPGHTIQFQNFAALYFNNVLVFGTGQIKLGNHTKLHAHQVIHVPA